MGWMTLRDVLLQPQSHALLNRQIVDFSMHLNLDRVELAPMSPQSPWELDPGFRSWREY